MPPTAVVRNLALLLTAAALALPAAAGAQAPPTDRTIVAAGAAQATVTPRDRHDNASIAAAVERAEDRALPDAVAEAREYAAKLAAAAGVQLGPLMSVSNVQQNPYFGPQPALTGTFGPGRFCGTVRQGVFRTNANGVRTRTGTRTRRVCRVPGTVLVQVSLTFAMG